MGAARVAKTRFLLALCQSNEKETKHQIPHGIRPTIQIKSQILYKQIKERWGFSKTRSEDKKIDTISVERW